ncbi:unnamed protein product [Microthlaspi erraticum]|uniref:Arabidopsis retrotransposon Orf1 C-terminal domain-containing protein n=1 Tax=Microthlaspi erraticum TaxID=1685480 RepID=A0A6D2JY73_9BRAS|nr:unnamed protein product [Microthlaspi erraticum]
MVSTTRGTLSRAAAEKAEGKKPAAEEGSGSRKSGSGVMKARDYAEIFDKMSFVGTRYPDLTTMTELGISQDCHYIFEEMQLARLMMNPLPAYKKETIEFLSLSGLTSTNPTNSSPRATEAENFLPDQQEEVPDEFQELEDVFHFEHKNGRDRAGNATRRASSLLGNDRIGEYM